jgi:hypothetical protein
MPRIIDAHPRRAFLLGAAAAAAIPAAGAMAAPAVVLDYSCSAAGADAGLLALQDELDEADRAWEALYRKVTAAEEACHALRPDEPKMPAAFTDKIQKAVKNNDASLLAGYEQYFDTYDEAKKAWREAVEQAGVDSGLKAAEDAANAADDVRLAIRDEIVFTPARLLAGLVFKAKYAAEHFPGDPDEEVMKSIVDDLLAMAPTA